MTSRKVTRILKKNGRRLVERGVHKCAFCHSRNNRWTYLRVDEGDVWARCPMCQMEQVVGEVK